MKLKKNTAFLAWVFLWLGVNNLALGAQGQLYQWEKCGPMIEPASQDVLAPPSGPADITAESAQLEREGVSTFLGDVRLRRMGQWLDADEVFYDKPGRTIKAFGDVRYQDSGIDIIGDDTTMDLEIDHKEMHNARYFLRDTHGRGTAYRIRREGTAKTFLRNATFTTCDVGSNAWELKAKKIDLDHEQGVGWATGVNLRVKDFPILYLPRVRFPIDDRRKSGFLRPSGGSSTNTGANFYIPYYWNIAPNRDATLIPHYYAQRGLMLEGEFRYLNPTNQGKVRAAFLPDDPKHGGSSRGAFFYQHFGTLAPRLVTNIDVNYVSDKTYFENFSNTLSVASTSILNNEFDLIYVGNGWNATGRVQAFKNIDPAIPNDALPARRLPQLLVDGFLPNRFMGLDFKFHGEAVNFQRTFSSSAVRLDFWPTVSLPFERHKVHFTPSVGVRDTQYWVRNAQSIPGVGGVPNANVIQNPDLLGLGSPGLAQFGGSPNSPFLSRILPVISFDMSTTFDREISLFKHGFRQTLEPRAYYLYVPYQDQSDFPIFDSAPLDFYFARLFQPNQFTGADRMSNANQITFALTSRLLSSTTGNEVMRASIGQIEFFQDPRVTMPGIAAQTGYGSQIVSEFAAQLSENWSTQEEFRYDPVHDQIDLGSVGVRYHSKKSGIIFNADYRFRRQVLEQMDFSGVLPIGKRWNLIGRWYHDIQNARTLEVLGGFEYDSCCWTIRVLGRNYVTNFQGDMNKSIMVQMELKGLGSVGQKIDTLLERSIAGYSSQF
ncbi:LPS-assembly protein LptD [Candidatus Nitrosacidococcus tergens]|uniref:LPS-assembly protein LptD n=1 Tax=Candidatus Nitrosacidococcus tergens TaxID=553981 RepID=A0A7G1QA57_9GAMM|nr:LPS assembly protein LptD [Candidatus Nitrosacidococcus tergens]CAB1276210.1 LPS-assembly protein LptD [Candidatus Nitrosacidococcus tergens]